MKFYFSTMPNHETSRLSRLTAIITLLQTKRILTATEISKKFGVSIRTIYRDIRALEEAGIPIFTEEGRGYSLVEDYRVPPVMFTEAEANALITAEQLILKNKDASFVKEYTDAVNKVKAVLRNTTKDKAELLSKRIVFRQNTQHDRTSNYLSSLQMALTNFNLVDIAYYSPDNEQNTTRTVEPFAVYSTQENWLLIAWCRLRKDFRVFRLDRIQSLTIRADKFQPHKITLEEYFEICRQKSLPTPDIGLTKTNTNFVKQSNSFSKMDIQKIDSFSVIGITIRTTNENNQAAQDIPALWQKFMSENIIEQIPNKINQTLYCIYTDYEKDYTKPYTTILGCKVSNLEQIPVGMIGKTFATSNYQKHIAKGNIMQGIVFEAWLKIWNTDIPRAYTADFEVYGERTQNPADAEVDIFIAVNE